MNEKNQPGSYDSRSKLRGILLEKVSSGNPEEQVNTMGYFALKTGIPVLNIDWAAQPITVASEITSSAVYFDRMEELEKVLTGEEKLDDIEGGFIEYIANKPQYGIMRTK